MGVSNAKSYRLRVARDARGELSALELSGTVPFDIVRLFYIHGVPPGTKRGGHAHILCQQFLICQTGIVHVELFDGKEWRSQEMSQGDALFIPRRIYASETFLKEDTVLLVLCDRSYEPADYINGLENYSRYLAENTE